LRKETIVQRINDNGLVFYRFETLGQTGVDHAIFTRRGGVSQPPFDTLNMGHSVGDDLSAVEINHLRALSVLGLRKGDVVTAHLVHSARVAGVGSSDRGTVHAETDALVTDVPDLPLLLRFADCVPVLFYDRRTKAIGMAHAGWRGVAARVVPATVQALTQSYGCRPRDLWAGIGPSIGPCCYEVGQEVIQEIAAAVNGNAPFRQINERFYLDLWAAVHSQLAEVGVAQIENSVLCTACDTAEWFSHRAEAGKTGRFGVAIKLAK
jgi:hypothetical protein